MGNFADFAIIPASAFEEIMRLGAAGDADAAADLIIDLLDATPDEDCALCGDELSRTRLGEHWQGVLALLTGGDSLRGNSGAPHSPADPRHEALLGEHEFFADAHYGVVSPERVGVVKQALEDVDADAAIDDGSGASGLRGLLGRRRQRIHGVACDYPVHHVRNSYEALVDIYRDAEARGAGVVIAIG